MNYLDSDMLKTPDKAENSSLFWKDRNCLFQHSAQSIDSFYLPNYSAGETLNEHVLDITKANLTDTINP